MFDFLKCKHPIAKLIVEKDSTIRVHDDDFFIVTYYFKCMNCQKSVIKEYAKLRNEL